MEIEEDLEYENESLKREYTHFNDTIEELSQVLCHLESLHTNVHNMA